MSPRPATILPPAPVAPASPPEAEIRIAGPAYQVDYPPEAVRAPATEVTNSSQITGWKVVRDRHVPLEGQVAFVRAGKIIPASSVGYLQLLTKAEVELEAVYGSIN